MGTYQHVEHAAFGRDFSTTDQLLIMRTLIPLIEKANKYHMDLYIAFIDFEETFDSVELWAIEQAMNICRNDSRYRRLINNIYNIANITVQ